MAFGDGLATDNSIGGPINDGGGARAQHDMAGARMAAENTMQPMPVGNAVIASNLPDVSIGSAGAGGATDGPGGRLDKSKSVGQLINDGVIQRSSAPAERNITAQALKPGETPQVTVTYADAANGGNQPNPDFIVKQDGTIQATGDPATANKSNVVIQVERAPGNVSNPDATQQQSIDGLVNYLYGRYSAENPNVAQSGLKLNDQYGLISGNVSQQVAAKPEAADAAASTAAARQNFAPQTQSAMSQGSRFTPGSSGSMSRGDIDNVVPERSQPMAQNETSSIADIKNAIASEYKADAATKAEPDAPYYTSRMNRVGTEEVPSVGRYGMTFRNFADFFDMDFDGDEDAESGGIAAKMDAAAKSGKVSKSFAAKFHNKAFAHKFVHAMHQMKAGQMLSKGDMKELLPGDMQEQIAANVVGKYNQADGGDVGKTALAFHLGKSPDKLSQAELTDTGNQQYQQTAKTFASLSHARDNMGGDSAFNYTVSQDGTLTDAKIKQAAISTANSMGGSESQHLCATGVQRAWARAGYSELLGSGDGWQMHNKLDRDPNFVRVDRDTAYAAVRAGHAAIVCRQWASDGNGAGHVETLMAGGNGSIIGASDYHGQHRAQNNYYNWRNDHFYLPKADVQNA